MNKKPFQSKKFIAFAVGALFTTVFTVVGLIVMTLVPEVSASVVNLITVSLASLNSVIGVYALGQSVVDYKINSVHNTTQENKRSEDVRKLILETKDKEFKYEALEALNWDKIDAKDVEEVNK